MKIRYMTDAELRAEGWNKSARLPVVCLEHEDGTIVFPSMDEEGNGPGVLFGRWPDGEGFYVRPQGE